MRLLFFFPFLSCTLFLIDTAVAETLLFLISFYLSVYSYSFSVGPVYSRQGRAEGKEGGGAG